MKNTIILYTALASCIAFSSGCNNDSVTNPTDSNKPLVTLVGTPTGPADTATIDANGGTLSSADGMLQLIVPAGAVSSATTFSIQPISNYCPGGNANAYNLLPEGITFAQPVTLKFSYADTLTSFEEYLAIAYQGIDKTWFAPKVFTLDTSDNKISLQTKHFTSFANFSKLKIIPSQGTVKINESLDLEVIFIGESKDRALDAEGLELANLTAPLKSVSDWELSGPIGNGQLVEQNDNTVRYFAPTAVPSKNPITVSATLKNVSFSLRGIIYKNPKVFANILVIDGQLFTVVFTSSRPYQPVGNNYFIETDRGSMNVLMQGDSVTVYAIQNARAEVTPNSLYDAGPECTYTVISAGDGLFHISANVSFGGVYSSITKQIYVGINGQNYSKGFMPSFQKSCSGGSPQTIGGEELPTAPAQFTFDATKDYQEFVTKIPGGGIFPDGFLKTAVTKVK